MSAVASRTVGTLICVLLAGSCPADEPGFTQLFDGKTLAGWTIDCLPKDKAFAAKAWTVDDGTLLANTMGSRGHFYILLDSQGQTALGRLSTRA